MSSTSGEQQITTLLKRLWHHIAPRRSGQFGLLLVLMIGASFAEIISIGAVLPYLAVLTAPERIFQLSAAQPFIKALGMKNPSQLLRRAGCPSFWRAEAAHRHCTRSLQTG
jgi:ATP-binding cassette subfamily B protein